MASVVVDPRSIRTFENGKAFERWLRAHHDKEREVYLRIFKKGASGSSVTTGEALDIVLCWGWIDGIRKSYDEQSFLQRYTPRKAKSIWSQINREHVARLMEAGRMQPPGLAQVEAAKADGRWAAAYAGARTMTVPDELIAAIRKNEQAWATYETLDKTNLFALAFRLHQVKTPAGREKKIAAFVDMLARGERLHEARTKK